MKKLLKYLSILLFLVLLASAAFVYTFDANQYKKEVADVIGSLLDRPVTIKGDVDISVYPWIGIKLNDLNIENKPGFSRTNFASIGQFDISIKIIPLLQKKLDIDKLVMHQLSVDFEKNASGENNWSGLTGNNTGNDSVESEFGLAGLVIGGIELKEASFSWLDVSADKRFKISKMSLLTEAVVKGQPLPVTLKAYVASNLPEWQAAVSVETNLEFNEDSPTFDAKSLKLSVKALLPGDDRKKVSFAMISDSSINWQEKTAKLTKTKFSIFGLILSGTFDVDNIFSVPTIYGPLKVKKFEAEKLAKRLEINLPVMANPQSLKDISLTTSFKTDFNSMYLDDISANVDSSNVKGFVHITDISNAVIRYELAVDKIALHEYRSVEDPSANNEIMIPADIIRAIDTEGIFDVENVIIDDIEITGLHVTSSIKEGVFTANPVSMLVGESDVKFAMVLDARSIPLGKLTAEVKNIDAKTSLNPLLKTVMGENAIVLDGIVNASANISTKGASLARQEKSAKGTITIDMEKVVVQGIDLNHASRKVVADYANKNEFRTRESYVPENDPTRNTEFTSLHATFQVSHGKYHNSDLLMTSKNADISGSGSIDFINKKIDYRPVIDIHVNNRIDIRDKLRDHPMEYHVAGDFEKLTTEFNIDKYELLVGRLLLQESRARRNKRLNTKEKKLW
ncbi:MAG: AsmA family protein [Gammaproteobacteria bacterium]|nr:AsmA family protein [Gammaproteobacteria bacterium]